mgnify:CR=1 FL=1
MPHGAEVTNGPRMRRGTELVAWLRALPDDEVDREVERMLGIGERTPTTSPGRHLLGYFASPAKAVLQAIEHVPIRSSDVVVDLGSGLGKVLLLIHLATGARCLGIELQHDLVVRAREAAMRLGIDERDVRFEEADVRDVDEALLRQATVFYLYTPFRDRALKVVLRRLEQVTAGRSTIFCSVGADIERGHPGKLAWLKRRPIDGLSFAIYDRA